MRRDPDCIPFSQFVPNRQAELRRARQRLLPVSTAFFRAQSLPLERDEIPVEGLRRSGHRLFVQGQTVIVPQQLRLEACDIQPSSME